MAPVTNQPAPATGSPVDDDRRKFLASCGKFAVVTPPALTLLLSTSLNSEAIAHSGGSAGRDHGDRDGGRRNRDHDFWTWLERLFDRRF
jgi:hypothetical protein